MRKYLVCGANFFEAERLHRQCLEELRHILDSEHPSVLACMNNLAEVLESQGRLDEAQELGREILQTKVKVLGPQHSSTLATMSNLSLVLQAQGKLAEAKDMQVRSLQGSEELFWDGASGDTYQYGQPSIDSKCNG